MTIAKLPRFSPALLLACTLAALPGKATAGSHPAFAIPDTEVVDLPRAKNGIDYQLYVHVPPVCRTRSGGCPVMLMLDAEYSFALAATIVTHLVDRQRIAPRISVAIAYRDKTRYHLNRTRDYTPFHFPEGGYGPEIQKVSGGGPAFLDVIERQVLPYVERHYPASAQGRTLVGHSYGGLFAVNAWIARPELFENMIVVSPSLWYADRQPLEAVAKACATSRFGTERNLFLAVGEHEEQPENERSMVSDLKALKRILDRCESRKVVSRIRIFDDETHASIFPVALSSGLRALQP